MDSASTMPTGKRAGLTDSCWQTRNSLNWGMLAHLLDPCWVIICDYQNTDQPRADLYQKPLCFASHLLRLPRVLLWLS